MMGSVDLENWKQANEIYARLVDMTVTEALQELQGLDDEVSDEVRQLVITLISSGDLSSQFVAEQLGADEPLETADFMSGHTVGDYTLGESLGRGGMATVFEARRSDGSVQKPVAIKLFNRVDFTPAMLNRISIEQDILASLSHPNVVNLHHGGRTESGVPFMVMELIEGSLGIDDYVKSKRLGTKGVIRLVLSAARAVAYAHQNLIVHRDLKPSNLLVDASGEVKVVDFGIAKMMRPERDPQKTTILALTPSFASPEQINSGKISVATDVFSLATVCLSLLIKALPLPKDRLLKSCADDEAHIWQTLKIEIADKDLRNVLNQALQQDPDKRYRNMDLFADDLEAWLLDKPVQATPDSWYYRIQKFAKRRRALFATMLTLFLTLALSVFVLSWQYNKTIKEAQKALEVKNFMLNVFSVTHPDVNQGEAVSALDLLQKARVDIDTTYLDNPALKAELLLAIGTAFYQVGDWEKAEQTIAEAYELVPDNTDIIFSYAEVLVALKQDAELKALMEKHPMAFDVQSQDNYQSRRLRLLGAAEINAGEFASAEGLLRQAVNMDEESGDRKSAVTGVTDLVILAFRNSEYKKGIQLAEQTIADYESFFPPASTTIMQLKHELSVLYTKSGQFTQSQQLLEQILELEREYLGDEHPDLIQTMISLSESHSSQGQLDLAREMSSQAHELTKIKFGATHPKAIESYNGLATVVFIQGDYEQALNLMEEAIAISEVSFGEGHMDTLKLKRNYATALGALRRNEEAKSVLSTVLDHQLDSLGQDHSDTLFTQLSLVRIYGGLGESKEAVALGEKVVAVLNDHEELGGPIMSNAIYALGFAYFDDGQYEQAIDQLIKVEKQGLESQNTANFMVLCNTLSRSYEAIQDWENAELYARKGLDLSVQLFGAENIRTSKLELLLAGILVSSDQGEAAGELLASLKQTLTNSESNERDATLKRIEELEALLAD